MENTELKITKEAVLAAAAKCSTAKATLETLFPEVFEPRSLKNSELIARSGDNTIRNIDGTILIDWSAPGDDYISLNDDDYSFDIVEDRLIITPKK